MFREMRRNKQALTREECDAILERGTSGVLALIGDEDYPYAVPLSYVYLKEENRIIFHCAKAGHKLDAARRHEKASFCVISRDDVVPETYTTHFSSVIAFGRIHIPEEPAAIRRAIEPLAAKYAPHDSEENRHAAIDRELAGVCIMELHIAHMTGKQAVELMKQAQQSKNPEQM